MIERNTTLGISDIRPKEIQHKIGILALLIWFW